MTDSELLEEYARTRSEPAFAELAARHLNWVYSAALRQVRETHLADDVTQAVFIALARQARKLRADRPLSPWLFQVTRCAAISALRARSRRQRHEQEAAAMRSQFTDSSPDAAMADLPAVLDEFVGQLSAQDRSAILLRFCERKDYAEVAAALGISPEAARKRTDRAVEKLRKMFARRGMALTGGALATWLGTNTTQAAPPSLLAHVMATVSAVPSAALTDLATGAIRMMKTAQLRMAGVTLAIALTMGGLAAVAFAQLHQPQQPPTASVPPSPPAQGADTRPAPRQQAMPPKAVAMEFVSCLMVKGDIGRAVELLDKDAERKDRGKGSAAQTLGKGPPVPVSQLVDVQEIVFFTESDLPRLKDRYPDDMWDPGRIPAHIAGGTGCLVLMDVNKPGKGMLKGGMLAVIVKEIDGQPKVVYADDN